jgi:hypothetical protein
MLCPQKRRIKGNGIPPIEEQIRALADCPNRIAVLRKRLCSLSWFMAKLNEYIAREANKEDKVKGRFWESRFKCQALIDEAAIAACMVYVDLNPIRAGVASTPEDSDFTSIQERIRAWQKEMAASHPSEQMQAIQSASPGDAANIPATDRKPIFTEASALCNSVGSWLCPIQSNSGRRGILEITALDYFDLVDRSGRMIRSDKRGFIDTGLGPMLERIGAIPKAWVETISHFGSAFWLAAGRNAEMHNFAHRIDKRWFKGLGAARCAFS